MTDYIDYIEEQIKYFKEQTDLLDPSRNEITPAKINGSLAQFSNVQLALHAEYGRQKREYRILYRQFQMWWDEKYVEKRKELNPDSRPSGKWLSKGEIESETRVANKEEYKRRRQELDDCEDKTEFLNKLMDEWAKHGTILNTLSQNMRQEMISLSYGDRTSSREPFRAYNFENGKGKVRHRKAKAES